MNCPVLSIYCREQVCIICTSGGVEVVAAASEEALDAAELKDTLVILSAVNFYPQWTNNKKNGLSMTIIRIETK